MAKNDQKIGVVGVLVNDEGRGLWGKRINCYQAGYYGLPGGRVRVNESLIEAIDREVVEETGLSELLFEFVGVVRENQGDYDFVHFIFSARVGDRKPVVKEMDKCEGWEWFDMEGNLRMLMPGHLAAVELYLNHQVLCDLVD